MFVNITMVTVYKNNEERKVRALEFEDIFSPKVGFLSICLTKCKDPLVLYILAKEKPRSK
jgi:hypothetical protein